MPVSDGQEVTVRQRFLMATIGLALVAAGCTTMTLESYKPKNNDETLIVATLMKIPNGIKAKSADILMQAYADDLYVQNFNKYLGVATDTSAIRIGKPELRQAYIQVFRSVKEISMGVKEFRLVVDRDRAVAEGYTELLTKVEAGKKESREQVIVNEVTWRLKRGPLGWRVQEEIFH
jgi:ketosteroid isomerase-like protein